MSESDLDKPAVPDVPPVALAYAAPPQLPRRDPLALASFVCGVLPFVIVAGACVWSQLGARLYWQFIIAMLVVCPLGALLLGLAFQPRATVPGCEANRQFARAGITLALITLALLLAANLLNPATSMSSERANRVKCASNLKQVGMGLFLYANDHGGVYPPRLDLLITHADLNPECFVCASSNAEKAYGPTTQEAVARFVKNPKKHLSYIYLGNTLTPNHPADHVLAYEHLSNHEDEGMNVLFNDGHVEWYNADAAKYITSELQAGFNPPRPKVGLYGP